MGFTEDDHSEKGKRVPIPLTVDTKSQFLKVPTASTHESSALRKSKSFASSSQYEGTMKESEISVKQKTIMAFFDASLNPQMKSPPPVEVKAEKMPEVVKRSSANAIQQKRGSITSISDEILGDDDLKDVDAVFESLLNSTFQEIQARGRESSRGMGGKKRSVSSHPSTSARSDHLGNASSVKSSSGPITKRSTVNRKVKRKIVRSYQ